MLLMLFRDTESGMRELRIDSVVMEGGNNR
jgi:hypothetical protein